jgi:hypothetical protein
VANNLADNRKAALTEETSGATGDAAAELGICCTDDEPRA